MKLTEKGKYFTDRVSKRQVEVAITTVHGHLQGYVFVLPGQRVKDLLNSPSEQFLAVTDAVFTGADGHTQEIAFVALNKYHIVSVVPINEETGKEPEEEEGYYPY